MAQYVDVTLPDALGYVEGNIMHPAGSDGIAYLSKTPSDVTLQLQTGTTRSYIATWNWKQVIKDSKGKSEDRTDHYEVRFLYYSGDIDPTTNKAIWYEINKETPKHPQQYAVCGSIPENALKLAVKVRAVAKDKGDKKKTPWFTTTDWSSTAANPGSKISIAADYYTPEDPSAPELVGGVEYDQYVTLTVSLRNTDEKCNQVLFEIYKDDKKLWKSVTAIKSKADMCTAEFTDVPAGHIYCATATAQNKKGSKVYSSDPSDYSSEVTVIPTGTSIDSIRTLSETSVQLHWKTVTTADSYIVEYTDDPNYFDKTQVQSATFTGIDGIINGLTPGTKYYFRIAAVNSAGNSKWSSLKESIIGSKPDSPTTWSSRTNISEGESVIVYWTHNSSDGSEQKGAEIHLEYWGGGTDTITIPQGSDLYSYTLSNRRKSFKWKVRTKGITNEWSDWSTERIIEVYSKPIVSISTTQSTITHFPIVVSTEFQATNQDINGITINIKACENYDYVDTLGEHRYILRGDIIYSINNLNLIKIENGYYSWSVTLYPNDIDLRNDVSYEFELIASFTSGLTATASIICTVDMDYEVYSPQAAISYDRTTLSAFITPYCFDDDGEFVEDVTLSVYRLNYDGSYTRIASNLDNDFRAVVDPHPTFNNMYYRIIAVSSTTGSCSVHDTTPVPVDEHSIVLQWGSTLTSGYINPFTDEYDRFYNNIMFGNFIRLPYNVDISEEHTNDNAQVAYIGRERPVSYYGTQIMETATWNTDIPKTDEETLMKLRHIPHELTDVYVREPSGNGYWANVSISFSKKHKETVVPITLTIQRVDGGI